MRISLRIFNLLSLLVLAAGARAEAPQGYYKSLDGLSEAELKNAVYELIHNFTRVSSYSALPSYFQRTDVYPDSKRWWDMYSDIPLYAPSFTGLNREHSFPKSWWGGSTSVGAYVDLNHLYPSEAAANMAKSNYPLGELAPAEKPKFDNGISKVGYPSTGQGGGCQWVFEPDDEYKGDFARTYFYMATCYQDLTWKYTYMVSQNLYPTLTGWAAKMLIDWHRRDPVSDKEMNRNDVVYSIQNNRNPFIDHPELAEYLWGDKVGQVFKVNDAPPAGDPELITPTQGMSLDFGQVAVGSTTTSELYFKGQNLTGPLDLVLSGTDRAMFSIPSSSLSASLVNSNDGTRVIVTYKPSSTGLHSARLIISDGGLTGSRGIALIGECLPVPTLSACTATAPTDITSTTYRANWTVPSGDVVDYWVISRTRYNRGEAVLEEVLAEAPGTIIEDFDQSESESYAVQSVRLGYRSPMSNVVFVSHSGISGVTTADATLIVRGFQGLMRFNTPMPHTGVCVYDVSGALMLYLDEVEDNTDIEFPAGIYFVKSNECGTPVKVAVQ